jgi:hypothetical protein
MADGSIAPILFGADALRAMISSTPVKLLVLGRICRATF